MKHIEEIKERLQDVPMLPGVYMYISAAGEVIYVGKAKRLRSRLQSYFVKKHDNAKTRVLVSLIHDFRFFVVDSEFDALLLENNLIKEHQPRYNILLKDDKTFPWVRLSRENFARLYTTRQRKSDGAIYFGPYASARTAKVLVKLLHDIYRFRTCSLDLSAPKIAAGKYKVCFEYHLGRCAGPCVGEQEIEPYNEAVDAAKRVLKGELSSVLSELKQQMNFFSEEMRFEEAQKFKEKFVLLQDYYSKSVVVNPNVGTLDVLFGFVDNTACYLNYLHIVDGAVVHLLNVEVKRQLDEELDEIMPTVLYDMRAKFESKAKEVLLPMQIDFVETNLVQSVPQRGDKRKLLELAEKNARMFKLEKLKQTARLDPERHVRRIMEQMQTDLHLSEEPVHIECFDNSNLQGTNPVAACVVFRDGKPAKKDYRHFNVKTVEGPDDFASMREIVFRRYHRLVEEGQGLPQLIVIDGGKGQLSAAQESIKKLGLEHKVAMIGIAKRLEEIYFPNDPLPLYLDKSSETLKVIQHIRNEAHRFGITFHRNKRSKNFLVNELSTIDGVGEQSVLQLMKLYKTVEAIKSASKEDLAKTVGTKRAGLVFDYFHPAIGVDAPEIEPSENVS